MCLFTQSDTRAPSRPFTAHDHSYNQTIYSCVLPRMHPLSLYSTAVHPSIERSLTTNHWPRSRLLTYDSLMYPSSQQGVPPIDFATGRLVVPPAREEPPPSNEGDDAPLAAEPAPMRIEWPSSVVKRFVGPKGIEAIRASLEGGRCATSPLHDPCPTLLSCCTLLMCSFLCRPHCPYHALPIQLSWQG